MYRYALVALLLLAAEPQPTLVISAPHTIMAPIDRPAEVLVRVKIRNPPECFGLAVYWGDGERSTWETCDDDVYTATHKYRARGELMLEAQLWVDGKQVTHETKRLTLI